MIKLDKDIYWNELSEVQSEETSAWITNNVLSKLGVNDENPKLIIPEIDKYKRPYKWEFIGDGFTIIVEREYIEPAKWAKKRDTIKVVTND